MSDDQFRRLTGVSRSVFLVMLEILQAAEQAKLARGGRAHKLCLADRLLMALEYIREYRTYFHVSQRYGLSESNAYKTIRWIEDTLVKHKDFALPGRKALQKSDLQYDVVPVDVTESPVQRPKKTAPVLLRQKEAAHA